MQELSAAFASTYVGRVRKLRDQGILTDEELSLEDTGLWSGRPLSRTFSFPDHPSALSFVSSVISDAEAFDHHPVDIGTAHRCEEGARVTLKYETYEVKGVTKKDVDAIRRVDRIWGEEGGR
jgi:pterin-4a-carbinolamine dehydratase